MLRAIVGVIVGYLAMAVVMFACLMIAYLSMGTPRAFASGSYDPSTLWLVVMFLVGGGAALTGGGVCRVIAKRPKPVVVLACIVLVLGAGLGASAMAKPQPDAGPRPADVTGLDAMQKARTPVWVSFSNAIVGFAGVLVGGRVLGRKASNAS